MFSLSYRTASKKAEEVGMTEGKMQSVFSVVVFYPLVSG